MMKYSLLFFFVFIIACGSTKKDSFRVLFITKDLNSDYHKLTIKGAEVKSKQLGVSLDVFAPKNENDYEMQRRYLAKAANSGKYDAILLAPNHSGKMKKELVDICKSKMKMVIIDTDLDSDLKNTLNCNCGYVGTDNFLGGRLAAKYIKSRIQKGNIVLVRGGDGHKTSIDREKGFVSEIDQNQNFKIINFLSGQWEYKVAKESFEDFLKNNSNKIDAVFAYNDPMILAISEHYKIKEDRPLLVGYDGSFEVQQAILKNLIDASIVQVPEMMGEIAIKTLKNCSTPLGEAVLTPVSVITASRKLTTLEFLD
jgi:ABC-type sugar transport system substrate-binding protein